MANVTGTVTQMLRAEHVAHAYNPSCLGGTDRDDGVPGQYRQNVCKTPLQPTKAGHGGSQET
jgi:hypothetical protein